MMEDVPRFRKARSMSKLFPERFALWASVEGSTLLWVLYEKKDYAVKWEIVEESHPNLSLCGWNKTLGQVHKFPHEGFYGLPAASPCKFVFPPKQPLASKE